MMDEQATLRGLVLASWLAAAGCSLPVESEVTNHPLGAADDDDDDDDDGEIPAPFEPDRPYRPDIDVEDLSRSITNPLFPAPVGARWVYEAQTEDGLEQIVVRVLRGTKAVFGTRARRIQDTVRLDGELKEDTQDWYAQDDDGNVWYLGEDTAEYEDGEIVCHCGAWTAGVHGALPGITMLGDPEVGDVYRQEYLAGEAEDYAEVVAVGLTVKVPAGTFTGCVKTHDLSSLDPSIDSFKYACPGVGYVLEEEPGDVRVELVEYSGL